MPGVIAVAGFCAGLELSSAYLLAGNCRSIRDSPILFGMTSRLRARTVTANRLQFGVLEACSGPLALRLHGFPDSARAWRYLLPALAGAGFHAVAPYAALLVALGVATAAALAAHPVRVDATGGLAAVDNPAGAFATVYHVLLLALLAAWVGFIGYQVLS